MAESAVKSAANLLGNVLVEEGKYLWGAEGKVKELRDELLWMQSFLREADTLQFQDQTVQMWVNQIKDHVYEAEDIIDEFIINVASRRRTNGFLNSLRRYSCILQELYHLHNAASSIDSLTQKISTLSPKLEKYGVKRYIGISTDKFHETLTAQVQESLKYAHLEDKKIIGLERNAEEVIIALKDTKPGRGFHAIYGMGGLGKTTLATKVFRDNGIKQHFSGGQAFVYISKQFQPESVLQDVLKSLNSGSSSSNDDVVVKLQNVLKESKCLVVLDDVWTQQAWDRLKPAFTSCGGDSGSKVLITTRKEEVAKYVDSTALQKPDPLNDDESWELLQKTMGWETKESSRYENAQIQIVANDEDDKKMKLGKEMMKVCKGLPLAIVVLGGILRNKHSFTEWSSVHSNLCSHLRMGYDHGRSCMDILLQSYTDLPYHLKPCFLHLACFPEDFEIETESLYWMWVAEGLVVRSFDRRAATKSLEEVANDYLNSLAQSGLVEIVYKTSEGWIESVRLHDLVRDVCLEKAAADDLLKIVDHRSGADRLQLNTFVCNSSNRLLRLSIYVPKGSVDSSVLNSVSSKAHQNVRSLLSISKGYGYGYGYKDEDKCRELMERICNEFRMLRALFLKNINLKGKLSSEVGSLMHLRYLSLNGTKISELPSSIGNLRFLEILDLGVYGTVKIPNTLWKLFRLRHLILPHRGYEITRSKVLRVDTLIWLERIENLQVKSLRTKDLRKLRNLRKLVIKDEVSTGEEMLDIIAAVKSDARLSVRGEVISKKPGILSSFVCNHELTINGRISGVETKNVEFSQHLESLTLVKCELEDDPMGVLGSLCHLEYLNLSDEVYVGKKMSSHSHSFPLLTSLYIRDLSNLEEWELERGSMPKLNDLRIINCRKLKVVPDVLPSSLEYFDLSRDLDKSVDLGSVVQTVEPYGRTKWLENAVLKGKYEKVVVWGKCGAGQETLVMNLYRDDEVIRHFDVVARICFPSGRGPLPRRTLQRLAVDLNPRRSGEEGFSEMSSENWRSEIQRSMQERKCLVILEEVHQDDLKELDNTFGIIKGCESKLVITITTSSSDIQTAEDNGIMVITTSSSDIQTAEDNGVMQLFQLRPATHLEAWYMLDYGRANAGIMWNMLRHCGGHPLSAEMLFGLRNTKEDITEWATTLEKFADSGSLDFSQIFALFYNDLPLHLRYCLIYLASFPKDVEISIKKLYQMWIAAGFVGSKYTNDLQIEEESLACSYLTDLVKRGMVTILKRGPYKRAKTCRLKLALRDVILEKAREEHILKIFDHCEDATSTSNPSLRTQQLALYLDQISPSTTISLVEQLKSLNLISPPTSLLIFPNVIDPLYREEKWEWFIYICEHFQSLWVLDLESMWMTKGCLPKEIGNLGQLRYLSLRGTWVSQLPPSMESLWTLQTLDLRVLESIIIPDVLWKLYFLEHLYLPYQFTIAEETTKLRLHGLNYLQTLANLQTDKVCLNDLLELKQLQKISIRKIHAVDELDEILKPLSTSAELCISSEIINDENTILSRFKNMRKLKIKGRLLGGLQADMFPTKLEELTLKHTKLEEDPIPVLEKLLQLRSLCLGHDSFSGKSMTLSEDFPECITLTLCSLIHLEELYFPRRCYGQIVTQGCWRITWHFLPPWTERNQEANSSVGTFDVCGGRVTSVARMIGNGLLKGKRGLRQHGNADN